MQGRLNEILKESISNENEKIIMDLIKRKMTECAEISIKLLHAMEGRFGPEAREVISEMAKNQKFPPNTDTKEPEEALSDLKEMIEKDGVGSHEWECVINEPNRKSYKYSRCVFAEIFNELGEPDLGWLLCACDEPFIESYHAGLGFKRTKTLIKGDDYCNHTYFVKNNAK